MAGASEDAKGGPAPRRKAAAGPRPDRPSTRSGEHRRTRLLALGIAAAILFPMLATSGIWDPYELDAADLARRIALRLFGAHALEMPGAINVLPTLTDLRMGELPFTSMAVGFRLFGLHDWTGRLPLALWGFAGVVALYELVARLVDRRAGLYAAIALVTMPLYVMQARTMLGDIVTMSALTIAFAGLAGAMFDAKGRLAWLAAGAFGLVAGYFSRGLILGVAVPALALGLTWVVLVASRTGQAEQGEEEDEGFGPTDQVGVAALVIGAAALALGIRALLHTSPDAPLVRSVGFLVQKKPANDATFDLVIRQLGHALFPWSAFLPFALGRLMRAPVEAPAEARGRETGLRVALIVGSAVAYGAYALLAPKSGTLPFSAPALLAGAAGLAIFDFDRGAPPSRALALAMSVLAVVIFFDLVREQDRVMACFVVERPQFPRTFQATGEKLLQVVLVSFVGLTTLAWFESQPEAERPSIAIWIRRMRDWYREAAAELARIWNGNLLFGLVVVEAALVGLGAMVFIGRRIGWAPVDKLPKNFADVSVNVWWVVPAALAALPGVILGVRDAFRALAGGARLSRASFTMIGALVAGGTLSFGYFPGLAAQLSPKEAFESYAHLAHPGEPLGLLSVRSRAAAYYSGSEAPAFTDAAQAFAWLTANKAERRWLLLKADDLPRLNSLYRTQNEKNLPILDGRSSQILLASNQLGGHANENALAKMVLDEPPKPEHTLDVMFEDQLAAIGWEVTDKNGRIVDSVVPATSYHLRTYYRVVRPLTGTWKAFVHIDGFQRRYNGDHNVLDGKYAMNLWRPGDVIVDDFEFQLEPNFTPGGYTLYFGFFVGETRFKVTKGPNHENRVVAGVLDVR